MGPEPPLPSRAEFVVLTSTVHVYFDKPLVVQPYDERAHFARFNNLEWVIDSAAVQAPNPRLLILTTSGSEAGGGAPITRYDGVPLDLVGQNGLDVAHYTVPLVGV